MTSRPNVILITTDQQRRDTLGTYGADWMRTPNLDRLAEQGVRFDRAYCTSPVCTPSRVSIFTGRQVSRHGVWNIGVNTPPTRTVADTLAEAEYRTHYVGKVHFQAWHSRGRRSQEHAFAVGPGTANRLTLDDAGRPPAMSGPYYGFQTVEWASGHANGGLTGHYGAWVREQAGDEAFQCYLQTQRPGHVSFGAEARDWSLPARWHNTRWTADRAVEFLSRQDQGSPFFLAIGFQDPHHPHAVPEDLEPRVDPARVPLPSFVTGELDDKPAHFGAAHRGEADTSGDPSRGIDDRLMGQLGGFDYRQVDEAEARRARAYYFTLVQYIDQAVGRILDQLATSGLERDTLVVFTSDHGELLGDHGLWLKGPFHFEALLNVPLIMRWPAGLPAGRVHQGVFSLVDLAGLLVQAGGCPWSARDHDGVETWDGLRGNATPAREAALIECVDNERALRLKTLVTRDWKLTAYVGGDEGELYHLADDPYERVNLWRDHCHAATKAGLLHQLVTMMERAELDQRGERVAPA